MLERSFATKFRSELREQLKARNSDHHLVTLYDAPRSGKKVYDSYCVIEGTFLGIEFKSTKAKSVNVNLPSPRQLHALTECEHAGGEGWIITHLRATNQVLIVRAVIWKELFGGFKNIKIGALVECQNSFLFLVDREKCLKIGGKMATRWNLQEWLGNVG